MVKLKKIVKIGNSKIAILSGPLRRKFRKRLKRVKSDLREEYRFEVLAPIWSHVNENEKNSRKIKNSKLEKFKTVVL